MGTWLNLDKKNSKLLTAGKKLAVPGVEPGSSGSQPLMLTTTPYDRMNTRATFDQSERKDFFF